MQAEYINKRLERLVTTVNVVVGLAGVALVVGTFGFMEPVLSLPILMAGQFAVIAVFLATHVIRYANSTSKREYILVTWFDIPILVILLAGLIGPGLWFAFDQPWLARRVVMAVYIGLQVVIKGARTMINWAAAGGNPTKGLIGSFVILILTGALMLMLPRATVAQELSFVDALFTATSATCVTGLVVLDTGSDFTRLGQVVILTLIQLGGLGIIMFGGVIAVMLGQAFSVRQSVAMQDLLSARLLGKIGRLIAFIFIVTLILEGIGAILLYRMWPAGAGWTGQADDKWFYSVFHSVSAFCNAGFALQHDSLIRYSDQWQVYAVIPALIILGGLGFGVIYNISQVIFDHISTYFRWRVFEPYRLARDRPARLFLHTKVVLVTTTALILAGMAGFLLLENFAGGGRGDRGILWAFFQSITTRTAGFNTVDIAGLSPASKVLTIMLMFIGGSPASAAGGIKTVTLAVVLMTVMAAIRKRQEVEMFHRSIRLAIVSRALTVTVVFASVLFATAFALSITEAQQGFSMMDIMFESASALGTVGLSTGITASLSDAGRLIIVAVMLIGRLGPLTMLTLLTFNLKPVTYNYPNESVIVG